MSTFRAIPWDRGTVAAMMSCMRPARPAELKQVHIEGFDERAYLRGAVLVQDEATG